MANQKQQRIRLNLTLGFDSTLLTLELHVAQMQNRCNCTPNGVHLVRLEAQCLEGIAGSLVVGLLRENVHAALVQIMVLGGLLVQIVLTQFIVIGATQKLLKDNRKVSYRQSKTKLIDPCTYF